MEHVGIDVHKNQSQICIIAESGELIERRIVTDRKRLREVWGDRSAGRESPCGGLPAGCLSARPSDLGCPATGEG